MELWTIQKPVDQAIPIIANLPHSGMFVPSSVAAQFTPEHLASLPNTDWHLDKLYSFLPDLGIIIMQATHSRYVVDLNRGLTEPLFGPFWSSVVAEQTAMDRRIYKVKPTHNEVLHRVQQFYTPYHQKLEEVVQATVAKFGKAYLLHLHSFFWPPHNEIDLGDVNGKSCSEFLISCMEQQFQARGYKTVRNSPYSGGHIIKYYGEMPGVESLQVEIRYHVYLKESQLDKPEPPKADVPEMQAAQKAIREVFSSIIRCVHSRN